MKFEEDKKEVSYSSLISKGLNPECPECSGTMRYEEGCVKCNICDYVEC